MIKSQQKTLITNYRVGKDGDGYVSDENDNSYLIPLHKSMHALQRDKVEVALNPKNFTGEVINIVKRAKSSYRCTLTNIEGKLFAMPTDSRDGGNILIVGENGTHSGEPIIENLEMF